MGFYKGNVTPKVLERYVEYDPETGKKYYDGVEIVRYDSLKDPKGQVIKGKARKPSYGPRSPR
tara:strand:+ start:12958 stop:13146 length:189 start_codon:yes stop_codon:yes gene_type:complete